MLLLMKQYGRTIVVCLVSMLMFGAFAAIRAGESKGLAEIVFRKAMEGSMEADSGSYADVNAVKEIAKRSAPEIKYTYMKAYMGNPVDLNAMFAATDADGNMAEIEILDIFDHFGNSVLDTVKNGAESFLFREMGIYTLRVKAVDHEKKVCYGQYRLPVTHR